MNTYKKCKNYLAQNSKCTRLYFITYCILCAFRSGISASACTQVHDKMKLKVNGVTAPERSLATFSPELPVEQLRSVCDYGIFYLLYEIHVVDKFLLGLVRGKCTYCKRLIDRGCSPRVISLLQ